MKFYIRSREILLAWPWLTRISTSPFSGYPSLELAIVIWGFLLCWFPVMLCCLLYMYGVLRSYSNVARRLNRSCSYNKPPRVSLAPTNNILVHRRGKLQTHLEPFSIMEKLHLVWNPYIWVTLEGTKLPSHTMQWSFFLIEK